MLEFGLTEEEAKEATELLGDNFFFERSHEKRRSVLHLGQKFFAVVEGSEAMDWIWQVCPEFQCITVHEYVVVELDRKLAIWCILKWC
jgi:hypothetical protein